jgi:hypothetical protein
VINPPPPAGFVDTLEEFSDDSDRDVVSCPIMSPPANEQRAPEVRSATPYNYVEFDTDKRPVSQAFFTSTPHNPELHIKPFMWSST